jgi:hypothetical protein
MRILSSYHRKTWSTMLSLLHIIWVRDHTDHDERVSDRCLDATVDTAVGVDPLELHQVNAATAIFNKKPNVHDCVYLVAFVLKQIRMVNTKPIAKDQVGWASDQLIVHGLRYRHLGTGTWQEAVHVVIHRRVFNG